jgi:hypothetical protein
MLTSSKTRDNSAAAGEPKGFLAELWDAVSLRAAGLIIGVLALQAGFILSYVGAFHAPAPHHMTIAVAAPAQVSAQLVPKLNAIPSAPVQATAVSGEAAARRLVRADSVSSALIVNPAGATDTLLVASAAGAAQATAMEQVMTAAEARQHRLVTVTDVAPVQRGDARGLTGFYLVIGWLVGGYLVASLLGVASGGRPATARRAIFRLLTVIPYAIASGLAGAIIAGPVLGALTGHLVALWWLGALLVFVAAAATMAFQVLFGVLGIAITVLVFVILGTPSAGGAYQPPLLPPFWRAISPALPNGAGLSAARRIAYFAANGISGDLIVIGIYALAGIIITLAGSLFFERRANAVQQPTAAPSAHTRDEVTAGRLPLAAAPPAPRTAAPVPGAEGASGHGA